MQKTLANYGYDYQVKVFSCFISDRVFAAQIVDILKPEYFDSNGLSWVCEKTISYFSEYRSVPDLEYFRYELDKEVDEILHAEVETAIEKIWEYFGIESAKWIKASIMNFCKTQEVYSGLYDALPYVEKGELDGAKMVLDAAFRVGEVEDDSLDYAEDIELRYTELERDPIPTGIPIIDKYTSGGLAPGELGAIVAPGGAGKSWALSTFSIGAFKAGYNVLFISLELNSGYVGVRHDVVLTHLPKYQLKDNPDLIRKTIQRYDGSLTIKWFPTNSLTILGLRSHLDKAAMVGKKPDILIIDYADLMRIQYGKHIRKDEALDDLYAELRGIAGEYGIPVWTASQSTRSSFNSDEIGADQVAESMGKQHKSDLMISLSRKKEDKQCNTARFHFMKSRVGPDGMTFPARMDTALGIIELFDPDSEQADEIRSDIDGAKEQTKQKLLTNLEKFTVSKR